jgi:hypothetical protein
MFMSSSDPIKDAFSRVRQDIEDLKCQISVISQQLEEVKRTLQTQIPTDNSFNPTNQQINPTVQHIPTDILPLYALKEQDNEVSIGNRGVPTNKQTNQQTDKYVQFHPENEAQNTSELPDSPHKLPDFSKKEQNLDKISQIQRVSEVLDSLDSIKKEIRANFKRLTQQEMAVFSIIYSLEEQGFVVDYSLISEKIGLSETSIRDYIHKITKKGIPIVKKKENNKKIILSISPELKKIASLQTILSLREL